MDYQVGTSCAAGETSTSEQTYFYQLTNTSRAFEIFVASTACFLSCARSPLNVSCSRLSEVPFSKLKSAIIDTVCTISEPLVSVW